ncbi:type II secretion system protein GspC [Hyalangium minutum]|uniref:General secretion pathway protein C n=1 Tax=Hyalangium minutum TaxID=394096 RepID=A0A085WQM4_9BACT|nr:type II secretion system protein GspC [Hyalangium minutum]KFE69987.1 General secretion pathway protein C [Hyalangium minutum]
MRSLIRPAFHAFTFAMLACACLLVAQTVNTLLGASLATLPTASEPARQEPVSASTATVMPLSAEELARYTGLSLRTPSQPSTAVLTVTVPTQLGLKLLGTLTSASTDMSLASVYEPTSQRTRTIAVGSTLQGAEVLAIERTRVLFLNNGQVELLDLTSAPAALGMPSAPPAPAAPTTGFGSSLRQTGPDAYAIARQDVENTLANLNQIATQARVVPSFTDGKPRGFKLFAMRPDSLYAKLGLKNGDILQRINGSTLDDPMRAMEAYHSMKGASRIELQIERDGQPLRKTYTVEN